MGLKIRVCGKYTVPIFLSLYRLIQQEWPFEKSVTQVISFFTLRKNRSTKQSVKQKANLTFKKKNTFSCFIMI